MDTRERTIQLIARTLAQGAQVLVHVHDAYLRRAFEDALQELMTIAIRESASPVRLIEPVQRLHRCIEDISTSHSAPLRALLLAERQVLLLLVQVTSTKEVSKPRKEVVVSENRSSVPVATPVGNGRVTETMQIVLDGIQQTQPVRSKDLIQQCSSLSERTVKRGLKQLMDQGYVVRDEVDGVVTYAVATAS